MNQLCRNTGLIYRTITKRYFASSGIKVPITNVEQFEPVEIVDPPEILQLEKLNYDRRRNDPINIKRARLLYQSRKRGMLENGLLLSTFAAKYLDNMNETEIDEYDKIINLPSNDWDIFYWAMNMKPTPEQFDNPVMQLLKDHVKNIEREIRTHQPDLPF